MANNQLEFHQLTNRPHYTGFVQTATTSNSGTTATNMVGTGVGSLTIPANFLTPGKIIRLTVQGEMDTIATNPNISFFTRINGVTIANTNTVTPPVASNYVEYKLDIVVRSVGASGTIIPRGTLALIPPTGVAADELIVPAGSNTTSVITQNTTTDLTFSFFSQWAVAPTNPLNIYNLTLEILN